MSGIGKVSQVLLSALFISVLTFAASNAEVPKSTFLPLEASSE